MVVLQHDIVLHYSYLQALIHEMKKLNRLKKKGRESKDEKEMTSAKKETREKEEVRTYFLEMRMIFTREKRMEEKEKKEKKDLFLLRKERSMKKMIHVQERVSKEISLVCIHGLTSKKAWI